MYLNQVTLSGSVGTDPVYRQFDTKFSGPPPKGMPLDRYPIFVVATFWMHSGPDPRAEMIARLSRRTINSRMTVLVVLTQRRALLLERLRVKVGDQLIVTGSLEQERSHGQGYRMKTRLQIRGVDFEMVWPAPSTFVRGHRLVNTEEWARYEQMERYLQEIRNESLEAPKPEHGDRERTMEDDGVEALEPDDLLRELGNDPDAAVSGLHE